MTKRDKEIFSKADRMLILLQNCNADIACYEKAWRRVAERNPNDKEKLDKLAKGIKILVARKLALVKFYRLLQSKNILPISTLAI